MQEGKPTSDLFLEFSEEDNGQNHEDTRHDTILYLLTEKRKEKHNWPSK